MTPMANAPIRVEDCLHTGPGTLAGQYLRRFWQPVFHGVDLAPGRTSPLRVFGQDYCLFRSEAGTAYLLDPRCPHRLTLLSAGWVEGEALRCFYHGWKFNGADGACLEQPPEEDSFCHKVQLRRYPVREYLGLIFAYLGEGEPPPFPLYPEFERFEGLLEIDSYLRECNYFQNLENALDMSHVGFVHGDNRAAFNGIGLGRRLAAEESAWGVTYSFTRADGAKRVQQFGMPNIFYMNALPTDPDIGWQESLFWWVPVDDLRHIQFSLHRVPATGEARARIHARRTRRRTEMDQAHQDMAEEVLAGRLRIAEVDGSRCDMVRLQDDVAQLGQGRIADRSGERLGRGDVGVIAIRKLWTRELTALRDGRETLHWQRGPEIVPAVWGLEGGAGRAGGEGTSEQARADIEDVRPFLAIDYQLRALRGEARAR